MARAMPGCAVISASIVSPGIVATCAGLTVWMLWSISANMPIWRSQASPGIRNAMIWREPLGSTL